MKRFLHIDFLRAVAILAVIAIHVLSDNLTSSFTTFIWNYLHIIIVAFIFCSGYVMYAFYAPKLTTLPSVFLWYKKRLIRLLMPFYWYLLAHYALMLLFPKFFSGLGLQFSWKFFLQSNTLIGGISLNWLPLLFLQLAVLFPLLVLLFVRQRKIFIAYLVLAFLTTLGFTIWQFPYSHYRSVMWIPWSLFLVLPWYFFKKEQNKLSSLPYFLLSGVGGISFAVLFVAWMHIGRSVTLIDNKYPPNLFYITYEMFGSFLVLALSVSSRVWFFLQKEAVARIYEFISRTSYSLFFIHYIVLDFTLSLNKVLGLHIDVWYQLIFVVAISLCIAWALSVLNKRSVHFLQAHNLFFTLLI